MNSTTTLHQYMSKLGMFILTLLLCQLSLSAQTGPRTDSVRPTVALSGEIRHRFELDAKFNNEEEGIGDVHLLRSRLQVVFSPTEDIEGVAQIQDARFFGQENGAAGRGTLDADAPALDLRKAYVLVRNFFKSGIDLQLGRQEFLYSNERLIGIANWNNTGRSFDAVRLRMKKGWGGVDLFGARLQGDLGAGPSENFYGLYSRIDFSREHAGDLFALLDNNTEKLPMGIDSGSSLLNRYTLGTYLRGSISNFGYAGEFVWQGGEIADTFNLLSIDAMLLSGTVTYRSGDVNVGALYTYLSGDDDPIDDKHQTFNTLFGTNHLFYGHIDYFPGIYTRSGLQDIALLTGMKFSDKARLDLEGHLLSTAVDIGEKNALGKEVNAIFKYQYNKALGFNTGAALFLADDLMEPVIGDDIGWWAYVMTTVTL